MLDINKEIALAEAASYFAAAGIVVAASIFAWSIFSRRRGAFAYLRVGSAAFSLAAMWFLVVDWSWFLAVSCPDCGYRKDVCQYRVFGIPVSTRTRESPTEVQLILNDLGTPCKHDDAVSLHRYRFWGLVYPAYPCINLTFLYDGTDRYTDELATKVRQIGDDDPLLADHLHDRIVRHRDYEGFWDTFTELTGGLEDDTE